MREAPGQEFYPYTEWEDWHAGMYRRQSSLARIEKAAALFTSPPLFYAYASRVTTEWPVATAHNLSNGYANHQPWIGRAACCLAAGATIRDTTSAWIVLSRSARTAANHVADHICQTWRQHHMKGQQRWTL